MKKPQRMTISALALAISIAFAAPLASASDAVIEVLEASATTPEAHNALARYHAAEALALRAEADRARGMSELELAVRGIWPGHHRTRYREALAASALERAADHEAAAARHEASARR